MTGTHEAHNIGITTTIIPVKNLVIAHSGAASRQVWNGSLPWNSVSPWSIRLQNESSSYIWWTRNFSERSVMWSVHYKQSDKLQLSMSTKAHAQQCWVSSKVVGISILLHEIFRGSVVVAKKCCDFSSLKYLWWTSSWAESAIHLLRATPLCIVLQFLTQNWWKKSLLLDGW
jgi:hypothetical protein